MYTVLLVAHSIVILFLIGLILLQRPEGDGLGGLAGGGGNLLSGSAAGNVLTRATAILAILFIMSSLALAIMTGHMTHSSFADTIAPATPANTAPAKPEPAKHAPAKPAAAANPEMPSVPKPE